MTSRSRACRSTTGCSTSTRWPSYGDRTALILAWPVASDRRAHELIELGVDGVITQDLSIRLRHAEPAAAQAATGDAPRSSIGT